MNLAIIPARGGSTRLKDKNILYIGNQPLISWTINAVIDSGCFDKIIVSSDSDKILDVASNFEVELHKRPLKFATKKVPVLEAILDIFDNHLNYDTISYFLPTCPFRTKTHIKEAFRLLDNADSVISVKEFSEPIQLAGEIKNGFFIPKTKDLQNGNTNSLFMTKYYLPNGGIYISKSEALKKYKNFFQGKCCGYIMDKESSHDINDAFDFKVAELITKRIK